MPREMNGSYSSLVAMVKRFLARLRQWIRQTWRHGQRTRNETEPSSVADQNKALNRNPNPTSTPKSTISSPLHEIPATEKVENLPSDDNPARPASPSGLKTPCEAQKQPESSAEDQWPLATAAQVQEQLPSTEKQQQDSQQLEVRDAETMKEEDETTPREHELPKESATVDYTTHDRAPVVEEIIEKQVHTVYQLERTRSNHIHEHFYHIQPIVDTSDDNPAPAADV
ncbi:hypothetical protein E4U21_001856 [Claviceps maximensis]|nr:hypothetical protein E4U21_001856 [Claviceps maximensis]